MQVVLAAFMTAPVYCAVLTPTEYVKVSACLAACHTPCLAACRTPVIVLVWLPFMVLSLPFDIVHATVCADLTPPCLEQSTLQFQSAGVQRVYSGPLDVIAQTVRKEGVLGLFKGYSATVGTRTPPC